MLRGFGPQCLERWDYAPYRNCVKGEYHSQVGLRPARLPTRVPDDGSNGQDLEGWGPDPGSSGSWEECRAELCGTACQPFVTGPQAGQSASLTKGTARK
jgi:hypothetical protein